MRSSRRRRSRKSRGNSAWCTSSTTPPISPTPEATLQKNSDLLRRWTSIRVVIEGTADSRGTNEYNLALGERRASAARDYIISLGIPAARMTIVSKGEEAPTCREESEACWPLNRRAYFVVTAK
jgi:peptidoglycan-associated lipoprotein